MLEIQKLNEELKDLLSEEVTKKDIKKLSDEVKELILADFSEILEVSNVADLYNNMNDLLYNIKSISTRFSTINKYTKMIDEETKEKPEEKEDILNHYNKFIEKAYEEIERFTIDGIL